MFLHFISKIKKKSWIVYALLWLFNKELKNEIENRCYGNEVKKGQL